MEPYVWLVVAAVMAVIEAATAGLFTAWFVVGALAAWLAAYLGAGLYVQIAVFLAVSVVCMLLIRPYAAKRRKQSALNEPFADPTPLGKNALVTESIDNTSHKGRVETPDHMSWAALSSDGSIIEQGAHVRVVNQQSTKLIVERI